MLRIDMEHRNITAHPYKIGVKQGVVSLARYKKVIPRILVVITQHKQTETSQEKGQDSQNNVAFAMKVFEVFDQSENDKQHALE
jgi:hypothetical protein